MSTGTKRSAPRQTRETVPALSKRDIDERIGRVMSEVASLAGCDVDAHRSDTQPCRPVWITPAELVARMKRFLVYN